MLICVQYRFPEIEEKIIILFLLDINSRLVSQIFIIITMAGEYLFLISNFFY